MVLLLYAFGSHLTAADINPRREKNPADLLGNIVQINVKNGCGVADAAANMTTFLRGWGFDVVAHRNYQHFNQDSTLVIDRVGNLKAARKVASALGLSDKHVRQKINRSLYVDVSVIIGHDYQQVQPFRK